MYKTSVPRIRFPQHKVPYLSEVRQKERLPPPRTINFLIYPQYLHFILTKMGYLKRQELLLFHRTTLMTVLLNCCQVWLYLRIAFIPCQLLNKRPWRNISVALSRPG